MEAPTTEQSGLQNPDQRSYIEIMESKIFKGIIDRILVENAFLKQGSNYYLLNDDLVIVITLQKSNYSKSYYINMGISIKKLNPNERPRAIDGDIRTRFDFFEADRLNDSFDLEKFTDRDNDKLKAIIQKNIDRYVDPLKSLVGLKSLLVLYPTLLYQTSLRAKEFLGINN